MPSFRNKEKQVEAQVKKLRQDEFEAVTQGQQRGPFLGLFGTHMKFFPDSYTCMGTIDSDMLVC